MPIPESQLNTWSALGSVQQSASTYESIRGALSDSRAPYRSRNFSIYLQGSYGNKTNVYRDSDVDIVICLDQTYYSDTDALGPGAGVAYQAGFNPAVYGYPEFKAEVIAWLQQIYGCAAVVPGRKAVLVKGSSGRRDADVLVCAEHRRYRSASTGNDGQYDKGICFWSNGVQIVNFPDQHAQNCTTKHQATMEWFKPVIRIYKNLRNRMVEHGSLAQGLAPSYFIEGMLWNVPAPKFGKSYDDSFVNTFNWIVKANSQGLLCANALFWLVRDNSHSCWPTANFNAYLTTTRQYWDRWQP